MKTSNVTLRLDKDLKEQADDLFSELGLSFTTAVNLFIRKSLRIRGIPFDVDMSSSRSNVADLGMELHRLFASSEAQSKLSLVNSSSDFDYGMALTREEVEQAVSNGR